MATIKSMVIRLSCLGWTQEDIGIAIGRDQGQVSRIMQNFDSKQIHNFHKDGKSIEEISSILNIDIQTVWHYLLKDKTDRQVRNIGNKFGSKQISTFHSDGKSIEEISSILNIDIQTV